MGADLMMTMCKMEIPEHDAIEKLKAMSPELLLSELDDNFCLSFEEGDDGTTEYQQAIEYVTGAIKDVYVLYAQGSRDTQVWKLEGKDYLITGGMSWGDDPTDAYQAIGICSVLQLTVAESD